ncbi:Scr1 family TA system antitoxin-like transcriptional regulator [Streptomyces sp. NPDC050149]|uniref:Scr1 family TA system antitoxin-like transcriptional regulator n=1 Tax=Streptomyces sp. NPDC050149 TaxID=3365603 RepID=UPI0037B45EEE
MRRDNCRTWPRRRESAPGTPKAIRAGARTTAHSNDERRPTSRPRHARRRPRDVRPRRTRGGTECEPPTVYSDGFTGDLYLDKPGEVARYNAAFADICTNASDEQTSRRLISEVAGSYDKQ